jgi:peptidoglycan/xylan/chitin deacetylase (PgdA/CDA1 family)
VIIRQLKNKARRTLASRFRRRVLPVRTLGPLVSFTFDDAPRSAMTVGARILETHDVRGTYYLSLGLLGSSSELGPIATEKDVVDVAGRGHELGCHTFDHHDAWHTRTRVYIESVDRNRQALAELLPDHTFRSFAYPKSGATLAVKAALQQRFECCRGGGQTSNVGTTDLNLLYACFIDQRARMTLEAVRGLLDLNAEQRGWLIFAAHAIEDDTSDFACAPKFLEAIVHHSLESGATVMPVAAACAHLKAAASSVAERQQGDSF